MSDERAPAEERRPDRLTHSNRRHLAHLAGQRYDAEAPRAPARNPFSPND